MPSPPEYRDLVEKPLAFEKPIVIETASDEMDETSLSVEQILALGKQRASEYLNSLHSNDIIRKVLDEILANGLDVDWIKWLIAGGKSPDEFAYQVKQYNKATICGLVWTTNHVAYRCKTCGIAPCMSLCAECFQRGHHEEHDFNMFRSQSGGACDCGDASVMQSSGFCDRHGVAKDSENIAVPPDLMRVARTIAPRILFEFIKYLRNLRHDDRFVPIADNFLSMLIEFSNMGSVMREVLTKALLDRQEYQKFTRDWVKDESKFAQSMATSQIFYEDALESLKILDPPVQYKDCPGLQKELIHNTFLEELFFWTVKFEFPEKIVYFLLNMLPDIEYKEALTETFVMHYSRIAMILEETQDPDQLPNRVVHLSVQLFYRENLAVKMTNDFGILHIMVVCLKNMMSKVLLTSNPSSTLNDKQSSCEVVDCGLPLIKECRYWPLVSDLNNILFHEPVARQFMNNDTLIEMWFSFLAYFQGMNVNQRELNDHIELESNIYNGAFLAELEASAHPMWRLLTHLRNTNSVPLLKKLLDNCQLSLQKWIESTNGTVDGFGENLVSFHIPLHRYLAMLICQAVNVLRIPLSEVLPTNSSIYSILKHPLRIQVAFYEIINGLWIRNGLQIKGQAMNYIQSDFCNSMMDTDLYLLQILSTRLPAHEFISELIDKFHIRNWFNIFNKIDVSSNAANNDIDTETKMLESLLQFIATLCSVRTNLSGVPNYEYEGSTYPVQTRSEIVTLLCVSDHPHSRLKELMPDRCGTEPLRHFDAILAQIADYKAPITDVNGTLQQALYIPKSFVWETLYDPIHALMRVQKEDFQNSMNRFAEFVRHNNLLPGGGIPWPPYRIPSECIDSYQDPSNVLKSRMFHAIIWTILYKAVYVKNVSEEALSLTMYLLELAINADRNQNDANSVKEYSQKNKNWIDVTNLELDKWFSTDLLSINLRTSVRYVVFAAPLKAENSKCESRNPDIADLSTKRRTGIQNLSIINRNKPEKSATGVKTEPYNLSSPQLKKLSANESIISMLLKLHSNLSINVDSFNPETIPTEELNYRIGDGSAFIAKVLKRIAMLDDFCREEVMQCCHRLYPQRSPRDSDKKDLEEKEESERKRIARERRQKIIEKYAHQREEFLKKNINDEDKMECEEVTLKEYHCVICKETSPSKPDMPMGLIVLVQPTNVLAHKRRNEAKKLLPLRDEDATTSFSQHPLTGEFEKKISSWKFSNSGCLRGVHVQTCGHHLHLECLKSHLQWLQNQQQKAESSDEPEIIELMNDEYQCPLCRQLANNVLPILPDVIESSVRDLSTISDREESDIKKITDLITRTVNTNSSILSPCLLDAIKKSISDMIESSYPNLRQTHDLNQDCALMQFIISVARSNLEIDLVQRGGSLLNLEPRSCSSKDTSTSLVRRSCLMPLLHMLVTRARLLNYSAALQIWRKLSDGAIEPQQPSSDSDSSQDVPLLLQDPAELLVQLVLCLPLNMDRAYFTRIVRLSYNLMYFQVLAQLSFYLEESERNYFRNVDSAAGSVEKFTLDLGMKIVISSIDSLQSFSKQDCCKIPSLQNIQLQIRELCLPFLRVACLLRNYLYENPLPDITTQQDEFQRLVEYLELIPNDVELSHDPSCAVTWSSDNFSVINSWFGAFLNYVSQHELQAVDFVSELHVSWKPPRLLELPRKYSVLFQYYHEKSCKNCDQVPQQGAICLVCGTLVCFQQLCCRRENVHEAVQHSIDCGSGTAIFLMISSTGVVIIRGKRAYVWGSIYLDGFGEEDIELKRGKPLFLSEERYQLLEQQWLSHRFDHTSKKWVMHRDTL
ncbi:E3 ubiquitin-protein ligase Ubr3-like [Planococcus citri]|uniref:E3 ubiquitin-protein ligase Ubr3-like n=1 Tax=Planococcus citri TaxID=170843 RepID=UPI0031F7C638